MATNTVKVELIGHDKSLGKTLRGGATDVSTFSKKLQSIGRSMMTVGRNMTTYVTLPIVAGFAAATKAAIDEEKEMALLGKALRNNADATDAQVASIERWITKTQNWSGIADGELRPALAALVAVTKDTSEAQDLLGVAMDIAVAKGKPVITIAEALAKAQNGNIGILSRYGIATRDAAGEMMTFDQVMQNAADTFGGSAAKAAETTAGRMEILKAKFADVSETLGTALMPVVERVVGVVTKLADAFNNLSPGWQKVITYGGLAVAAIGPLLMILGQIITIAPAVGAAFTAMTGPVGIIIVAIAALVAGLVVLYKKNETFRNFVNKAWPVIKAVVSGSVKAIVAVISGIWSALAKVIEWVKRAREWFAKSWAMGAINAVIGTVRRLIDALQTAWDWIRRVASSEASMSTGSSAGRRKPGFGRRALGGIVTRPELSYIGEAGPEAIIPLTKPARAAAVMREAGLVGVGGPSTINVNVVLPGGTTLIGAAEDVGRILAPHVARALGRTNARAQRRR